LVDHYQKQRRLAQVMLLLLSAQSLLAVLYSLGTISAFVLERSQAELATLAGRGFSDERIGLLFGLEGAVLALGLAFPIGPLLARLFLTFGAGTGIPRESWLLSLVAALFGWLALVVPIYLSLRRGEGVYLSAEDQRLPSTGRRWRRLAFEALLLVLGGLAYWQLLQAGTFVRDLGGGGVGADPVLLLGPTLLFVALGFALLRIVRPLFRWGAWLAGGQRGLVLPLGLRRLARESRGTGGWSASERVLLLVSLSTAMVVFSTISRDSVLFSQEERARALSGADLRLGLPLGMNVYDGGAETDRLIGVTAASPVCRVQGRWGRFLGRNVNFVDIRFAGIDTDTLSQVAYLGEDGGHDAASARFSQLESSVESTASQVFPVLLSPDAPPRGVKLGDRVHYTLGGHQLEFEVRGFVDRFPTLERPFALTELSVLQEQVPFGELLASSQAGCEWWVAVDPAEHSGLVRGLQEQSRLPDIEQRPAHRIVDDVQARLRVFQADLVVQTTVAALTLNALALALLSVLSYLMTLLLTIRRRWVEFSVLQAVGVTARQTLVLLLLESVAVVGLGLVAGVGLGYGLAHAMRAFVALVLMQSLGEGALAGLVVNWPALLCLGSALVGGYALALGLLLIVVVRARVHRVLRMPEE
jgi:putative ABC transport system permease protein